MGSARIFALCHAAVVGAFMPLAVGAQAETAPPLSVIDWLDRPTPRAQLPSAPIQSVAKRPKAIDEPPVTSNGNAPAVTTQRLGPSAPRNVGLVPFSVTGMAPDLWKGSDIETVAQRIKSLPDLELPAANALLFTLMLAEVEAPAGGPAAQDALTRARVEKLMELGAVDPAMALIEQAGAANSRSLFDLWAQLGLLLGTEDAACGALSRAFYLTQDAGLRIFCAARGGDWDTAALTFGSAKALRLLPDEKLEVLDRFLNPDLFEDSAPYPCRARWTRSPFDCSKP